VDAYLGLGSNLGDPVAELRRALERLTRHGVVVTRTSSLYRTEPVDSVAPEWYVNAAAAVTFDGPATDLLGVCLHVESLAGRERPYVNAPRTLDLDILLASDLVIATPDLTVPHPRMHERRFVLEPLTEIAPAAVHPVLKRSISELLDECADVSRVEKIDEVLAS